MNKLDAILEQVKGPLETEINRRVDVAITDLLMKISKRHSIPMKLLMEDLQLHSETNIVCLGMNKNGQRCQSSAKYNGFCMKHMNQVSTICPPADIPQQVHTHPLPGFRRGCPACENGL